MIKNILLSASWL